jgi:ATP synthase protein I
MRKNHNFPANEAWDQTADDDVVKPLTRKQAQALRQQNPAISPWMVLAGQAVGGVLTALVAWWVSGESAVGWSVMYGAMAVVIPGALFARGLLSKVSTINPATAVTGFFLWEMVKIGLVLAMLYAAPRLVTNLSWSAMLVGLVVTMKVVWLVLWLEARARRKSNKLSAA